MFARKKHKNSHQIKLIDNCRKLNSHAAAQLVSALPATNTSRNTCGTLEFCIEISQLILKKIFGKDFRMFMPKQNRQNL